MEDSPVATAIPGLTNTQVGGQNTINITQQTPAFDFKAIPWQMIPPGVSLTFVVNTTMVLPGEGDPGQGDRGSAGGDSDHQNVSRKRKNGKGRGRDNGIQVRKSRRLESKDKR